ncbi:class I SAM-dependent methyltransferase [Halorussus salinisoli]|uniref:class I SAM-dependent methyltransferase n=1 Tax=Halorussus salinisoli TaxID=2558242 RepID=UPI0010C219F7|nr:methyltransferase domain-containing protein [Halorussus salinisoli]
MSEHDNYSDGWQLEKSGPEAYEQYLVPEMFAPWADKLLAAGKLQEGDRVLDVACGTGIVARRASSKVGERGSVVGIDLNKTMLTVARATSSQLQHPIEWRQGDATDLPFSEESFDVVFCQQALQFIQKPGSALREMRRVLASGGRMAISVWRPLQFNPAYEVMADALETHVDEEAATMMRSPFPEWDISHLRTLIRDADFRDVSLTIEIGTMRYPSVEEFLRREAASSPLAEPLEALNPDIRDALIEDLEEALDAYTDDHGIVFPMEAFVAVARR